MKLMEQFNNKDLIINHLTMSLYKHAAICKHTKMMPKIYFYNESMILTIKKYINLQKKLIQLKTVHKNQEEIQQESL